jgi:hypothetical protein
MVKAAFNTPDEESAQGPEPLIVCAQILIFGAWGHGLSLRLE